MEIDKELLIKLADAYSTTKKSDAGTTLGDLIIWLERRDDLYTIVDNGFCNPHSYRGYYERLSFEPREKVSIDSMLKAALSAVGQTFRGWKGGYYRMLTTTPVYLANRGCTGERITKKHLLKWT